MWKYYLVTVFLFSGCSYFTISGTMCDQIASDPHSTIPQECRNYNEAEADKAFHNTKHHQNINDDEVIKFQKEHEE